MISERDVLLVQLYESVFLRRRLPLLHTTPPDERSGGEQGMMEKYKIMITEGKH